MPIFQGVAHRQTNFTLSCVIPLRDLATAHSPSGKELNPFFQEDARFFRALHLGIQSSLHPASSLFGTQQQLTHPPVKSSILPLRKIPVFQGVALWHTIFTLSCAIALWDSVTAHSPSGKELNLFSLEESCFSGLIVFTLFCLDSIWFGAHPCYSLNPCVHLCYMWSFSIAKDRRFAVKCSPRPWWS